MEEARKLFPQHSIEQWQNTPVNRSEIPLFNMNDLLEALSGMKNNKAPGPDGMVSEIIKIFIKSAPDFCLNLFNNLLVKGSFPEIWKKANLVLIEKEKKATDKEPSYRPICLLDAIGKVYEQLIKTRLVQEITTNGGLSEMQFGFVAGKSTIDAMFKVKKLAKAAKKRKKLCVMVMLDIKNAFNSVPWKGILEELNRKNVAPYLVNVIADYFRDRKILVDKTPIVTSCGVPQGSVLGPILWNIYYDPILRLKLPPNTKSIAYADDLVVITAGNNQNMLELETRLALLKIEKWIKTKKLELAPQKTEAVMLVSNRATPKINIEVGGIRVETKEAAKYLGVMFDKNMRMTTHIAKVAEKAGKVAANLGRIMPNVSGPNNAKRKILATVAYSTLFYAVPIWGKTTQMAKYRGKLEKVQRRIMLRQSRSYRTASTPALQVISGTLPIEMMVEERTRIYKAQRRQLDVASIRQDLEEELLNKWQNKWNEERKKGQWTKRLIRQIYPWTKRKHGELTYELSQFLTGHGNFGSYLKKMNIKQTDECIYCKQPDTPEHMFFACQRWNFQREQCWRRVGRDLTPENAVMEMLKSEEAWRNINSFIEETVREKMKDQERIQPSTN